MRLWMDHIGLIVSTGSSELYRMELIGLIVSAGSSGSYRLDRIGISIGFTRRN